MAKPSAILSSKFPFSPTESQKKLFLLFDDFLLKNIPKTTLLLRGYAGTGKTTVVSAVVKTLPFFKYKHVLMAPTGRAAKVMSSYSRQTAFTIHKKIYKQTADAQSGILHFQRQKNYYKNTVFIVDEASMLSDNSDFGNNSVLSDLIKFVFEHPSNKLILIGDAAQLPPVGMQRSPALVKNNLIATYQLSVVEAELVEVMRQEEGSGILDNATLLRNELAAKDFHIQFNTSSYKDIFRMTGEKLEDGLRYAYDKYGVENSIIVCRSNKAAVQYNRYIRQAIHFCESEIEAGDFLMVVRNNYFYLSETAPAGFIANGDFVEVMKIVTFEDIHGFRFAMLELRMIDYPDQPKFEAKVMLDTLYAETASLSISDNKKLYESVVKDYQDMDSKKERAEAIRKDPYLNALQVKFAYALTCHKSQGGQWNAVFVDQGYLKDGMVDREYVRWLYTAVTRATDELFLVNFNPNFFA